MITWIILGVVALALILMYNTLISHKNQVENIFVFDITEDAVTQTSVFIYRWLN